MMQTTKMLKPLNFSKHTIKKPRNLSMKTLVIAVAASMSIATSQADVSKKKIGDLEIYQAASGGKVTVLMMLDTSGSMSEPYMHQYFGASDGATACNFAKGESYTAFNEPSMPNDTRSPYNFTMYGCRSNSDNGKWDYDRITKLKRAIFNLLDAGALDANKVSIGIGQFSSQSDANNKPFSSADSSTGKILVPAAKLDATQIDLIKRAVAKLEGKGGTPAANAYAEAGAYMFGNTTKADRFAGFDNSVSSSKLGGSYISPIADKQTATCDGRGIYFLTDGFPNNAIAPLPVMKNALGSKGSSFNGRGVPAMPQGTSQVCTVASNGVCSDTNRSYDSGMPEVGAFAQALRVGSNNPYGHSILTAVVGFGKDFQQATNAVKELDKVKVNKATGLPLQENGSYQYEEDINGNTIKDKYYDCEVITGVDAKNACNWGGKSHPSLPNVGGFGEGGFYFADSESDIRNSIKKFVEELKTKLPATPSGTIVIPDDPYRADSQLAVAYYPILQPTIGATPATWPGNLKKYNLSNGTLVGKDNAELFTDVSGKLAKTTADMWSALEVANGNDKVEVGGFFNQLKTPNSAIENIRTVYIEDDTSATDTTTRLRKFGVNSVGKLTLDNNPVSEANTFIDTTTYTKDKVQALLGFLGFELSDTQKALAISDLVLDKPTQARRILGATIHSTPSAVSYSATVDDAGKVTDARDDYVLFGSSDGALHLVTADDQSENAAGGTEVFAFIPKLMVAQQAAALSGGNSLKENGTPYFGVDAPWLVQSTYNYNFASKQVTVTPCADDDDKPLGSRDCEITGIYAYGGLRLGGEALYGMNLTAPTSPELMFSITPTNPDFSRMGQIWVKPTPAKIKTSETDVGTPVLIFGGGYDTCYEDESYQVGSTTSTLTNQRNLACNRTEDTAAIGNTVYIINAKTGALIWSATSDDNPNLTNSIVGGITVLDRNNDGFMDGIYFADLGGQVFRADFINAGFVMPSSANATEEQTATGFSNTRVERLLQPAYGTTEAQYNHRFYERPVVSFYRNPRTNKLFAMVNVLSGDRSSILSKLRTDNQYADRLYGIIDNDVTRPDSELFGSDYSAIAKDITDTNLLAYPTAIGDDAPFSTEQKIAQITRLQAGVHADGSTKLHGWYYPLTRFEGFDRVKYTKGIGRSEVIDSFLYTTVYNPDMVYGATDPCAARITGGSERQLYCLPYGICLDANSSNGTAGFARAGQGIQELTLGPKSATLTNQRLLIGTRSLTARFNDRVAFGNDTGKLIQGEATVDGGKTTNGLDGTSQPLSGLDKTLGDGSAPELIFNERYAFKPTTWFEMNQ